MGLFEERNDLKKLNKEYDKISNDLFVTQSRLSVAVFQQLKNKSSKAESEKYELEISKAKAKEADLKKEVAKLDTERVKVKARISEEWKKIKPIIKEKVKDASARAIVGATLAVPYNGQLLHVAWDMYKPYQEARLIEQGKLHRPDGSRVWKKNDMPDFDPEHDERAENRRKKDDVNKGSDKKKDIDSLLKDRELEIKKALSKGQSRGDAAKSADRNLLDKLSGEKMKDDDYKKSTKSEVQNKVKEFVKKDLGDEAVKKYQAKLDEERKRQEEQQKQFLANLNANRTNKR